MEKLDKIILKFFQKVSDFFKKSFDIDNFKIAEICSILQLAIASLLTWWFCEGGADFGATLIYGTSFIPGMGALMKFKLAHVKKNMREGFRNPFETSLQGRYSRKMALLATSSIFVFCCIIGFVRNSPPPLHDVEFRIMSVGMLVVIGCFFYFLSCTPLPPGEKKFEQKKLAPGWGTT